MKKYQIDEDSLQEIVIMLENYRDDLCCSGFASNYASFKRWEIRKLQRKLRNLERAWRFRSPVLDTSMKIAKDLLNHLKGIKK